MFPISSEGEMIIPTKSLQDIKSVLAKIEQNIIAEDATIVNCSDNKIIFRGGRYCRGARQSVLFAVSSGEIEIIPGSHWKLRYRFTYGDMLITGARTGELFR